MLVSRVWKNVGMTMTCPCQVVGMTMTCPCQVVMTVLKTNLCESVFRLSALSDDVPGTEFNPGNLLVVNFTPWQLLVDAVATFRRTVRILPVVWRMQLGIFRVVTDLCVFSLMCSGI